MSETEMHERENERKPSVEMDMHGGAKNRHWLFTRRVSELTGHQNALPLHGKCYFWERAVNCRRTSELRSCGAADLMEMRSCGPHGFAELRTCGAAELRTCGPQWAKNSKFSTVSKLKFWHLGFACCHSKAMFGCLPLNFSIISMIFAASGRLKA